MHKGQVINGYTILQDFTTAGSGLSKWTFADKNGQSYFLKEFLSPTYPTHDSPGSEETKARKLRASKAFESHAGALMKALTHKGAPGGNLIVTTDMFRVGAKYYKATTKVEAAPLAIQDVYGLSLERRLLILLTLAHSLRLMHSANIVHGDLKPENVLLKQTITGDFAAKLIDLDSSYFSGAPPPRQELIGDPVYYAPEVGRYIEAVENPNPASLTTRSDIFALGLLYTRYLTGQLPTFNRSSYRYPYVAAGNGGRLTLPSGALPPKLHKLLKAMLSPDLKRRPDIQQVFSILKEPDILAPKATKAPTAGKAAEVGDRAKERKIEGMPATKTETPATEVREAGDSAPEHVPEVEKAPSKLKGTLISRREDA